MRWFWCALAVYWAVGLCIAIPFMVGLKRWAGARLPASPVVTIYLTIKWSLEWLPLAVMYAIRFNKRR